MNKLFTTLIAIFIGFAAQSQVTVYETGNGTTDDWTGWSTPVVTNCTPSFTGIHSWQFAGTNGANYTIETYRQFTINTTDMDIYFNCLTQNSTFSLELSTDNVTYNQIGTQSPGAGYSIHNMLLPTVDPGATTFYLKIKVSGTFASPTNSQLYDFKINAVLGSGNTVAIGPAATQNIIEGQNGASLFATESPATATSREWKFTTTSGSGYNSFTSAETSVSYVPNFANSGTYYIISESNFSGDIQTSNEVIINVTAPVKIDEFELGSTVLFANGELQVIANVNDYTVAIIDINGKLITSQSNLKSYSFSSLNEGVYFVNLTAEGHKKTIKIAYTK